MTGKSPQAIGSKTGEAPQRGRLPFSSEEERHAPMKQRKRLGIPPHLYALPLKGRGRGDPGYEWVVDAPARNAIALREGSLDLAFLTPIEYARESSLYYIIRGVAVSSRGGDGSVALLFREGVDRLSSLAIDPSSASEIVLASIILAEQFNIRPSLVPCRTTPEASLQDADAVLLVGDRALRMTHVHGNTLDLVEEWEEMTSLPYVHGIWCGQEHAAGMEDLERLRRLCTEGRGTLTTLSQTAAREGRLDPLNARQILEYLEGLSFEETEDVEEGLREFIRYAYYHGVLPDIVDLQYYDSTPETDDEHPPSIR